METKDFLFELSRTPGASGYEAAIASICVREFKKYCDDVRVDNLGNVIAHKKGNGKYKIMFAAHMDEIGLMVRDFEKGGFILFDTLGGFDQRALVSQEVLVHTKNHGDLLGVIGVKPPHLINPLDIKKSYKIEDMAVDTGYSYERIKEIVSIGDIMTIKREPKLLKNDYATGKAFDDRAGLAALLDCMKNLKDYNTDLDIYYVGSVQEEVGCRGAKTAAFGIKPDIAIAVDVGFGKTPELSEDRTIKLGEGPGVGVGPNVHPRVLEHLKSAARENNVKMQIEVLPFSSGTDASLMQISRGGVCTGILSIPLKYMHTSVETMDLKDIKETGRLLSSFVIYLSSRDMEESLCL